MLIHHPPDQQHVVVHRPPCFHHEAGQSLRNRDGLDWLAMHAMREREQVVASCRERGLERLGHRLLSVVQDGPQDLRQHSCAVALSVGGGQRLPQLPVRLTELGDQLRRHLAHRLGLAGQLA